MTPFPRSDLRSDLPGSECPLGLPMQSDLLSLVATLTELLYLCPAYCSPREACICCLTSTTSRISDFQGLALGLFIQWRLPSPWSCASDGVGTGISIRGVTADAVSKPWSPRPLWARECARASALTHSLISRRAWDQGTERWWQTVGGPRSQSPSPGHPPPEPVFFLLLAGP